MDGALSAGEYVAGLLWLGATVTAIAVATGLLVRRRLGHLGGSALAVSAGLIFFALLLLVHVVPLALTILSRPAVLACAVLVALGSARIPAVVATPERKEAEASSKASIAIASIAVLGFGAWWIAAASGRIPNPVTATDVATFDLPTIARWIQTGSMWHVNEFVPEASHGSYPHDGLVAMLAVVLPWEADFAARSVSILAIPFSGLAVYALARELAATRASSVTFAVAAMSLPVVGRSAVDLAMPDALMLMCMTAGALFLVRHARTDRRSDLALAGVALGLAFGTKWYGVSDVAIVFAVWATAMLLARRGARKVLGDGVFLGLVIAACGSIWLIRNWIAYDNPLFPLDVSILGIEVFDAPPDPLRDRAGESIAHRLANGSNFDADLYPALRDAFSLLGPLLLAAAVAAGIAGIARARHAADAVAWPTVALAVCAVGIVVAYVVTPYTAGPERSTTLAFINARYALPGLFMAAACGAVLARWAGRGGMVLEALALIAALAALTSSASAETSRFTAAVIGLVGLAFVIRWAAPRTRVAYERHGLRIVAAGAGVVLIVIAAAGFRVQKKEAEQRLIEDGALAYVLTEAEPGDRIGIAGEWATSGVPPVLSSFGPTLENEVEYVGPVERGFIQRLGTADEFRATVDDGHYRFLVVGLEELEENHVPEWLAADGIEPLFASDRFAVYPGTGS